VNLPVLGSRFWLLARFDCSRFFTAFIIFHTPTNAAAQGAEVVAERGVEMAVAEGEAEKTRRRDDFGDDLGKPSWRLLYRSAQQGASLCC
jgi:hypothetical protein